MVAKRAEVHAAVVRRRRLTSLGLYVVLLLALVPIMFPYYWMIVTSLKTKVDTLTFSLIFKPTLANYVSVFVQNKIHIFLLNSLIVGLASTALGLALGLPAAFSIARFKIEALGVVVLVARMLPGIAMLVPWYIMFIRLKLVGTYGALIFSHLSVSLPLIIWVSIGFFEDLPGDLMDAAAIDGCSLFGAFWHVALPLVRPGVAASGVLAFIQSWNNFLYSLILGGTIKMAPVAAYNMMSIYEINWGAINAAAVVVSWPVILLSLPFGKNLVRGLTAGAVK
jgi:multiple sugar transport system permease protein